MRKKYFFYLLLLQLVPVFCFAQSLLPISRTANWRDLRNLDIPVLNDSVQVNINDYGADPTGVSDNSAALASAISFLKSTNKTGIVYFGAGTYLFNSTINLTDNLILKGTGAATTKLRFIMGGQGNLIVLNGALDSTITTPIIGDGGMGQYKLRVTNPSVFNVGDMVKLAETDTDLMVSTWAYGNVGQIMQIKSIVGDSIEFYSPMRILFPASRNPFLLKANTVKNVGISCLSIVRGDNVTDGNQYSNIVFSVTSSCWINGIQSDSTVFAHVALNNSYHDVIKGSYFTNSYDYGSDGRGYGIACQYSSSENLVFNNVFKMLRHAMLMQVGANGNVYAYNYSRNTYWTGTILPSDASGDIVFHGNYPFCNLFEGNIVQNLELDNTHGINGPYNLFFRNRGENVGIFMNNGAGDSSAFIGNEVTTSAAKSSTYFGLAFGLYTLTGNGNFEYGNNIKGTNKPTATSTVAENSYYLALKPAFFGSATWPSIGYPNTLNTGTNPAKTRYDASNFTICNQPATVVLALANITLSGQSIGVVNNLSWTATAADMPTVYKIMASTDGIHFDSIGQKITDATLASASYQFSYLLDTVLQKTAIIYYKVIAYQKGVVAATSNIYAIKNLVNDASQALIVTVYPNPTNGEASAIFYAEKDKAVTAKLIDQYGKQLVTSQIKTVNGWNKMKFSLVNYPAGSYRLVLNLNGIQKTLQILKQ